jgi:hypothetical protein
MKPPVKKIFIIGVYITIFAVISLFIYLENKPKPNCFDKKMNQNEEGVDCGGVCDLKCPIKPSEDIKVTKAGYVESGINGKFDLYVDINNPNNFFGVQHFDYEFKILKADGSMAKSVKGKSFIMPGESKFIVEHNVAVEEAPERVIFEVANPQWVEFSGDYLQKPELRVVNKQYNEIVGGIGYFEATGLIKNESPYDFTEIKIIVILKDSTGNVVALNSTIMGGLRSGENRDFRVFWPNRFSGNVGNMEIQTEVNLYDSDVFMQR